MIKIKNYFVLGILCTAFLLCVNSLSGGDLRTLNVAICQIQGIDSDREGNFIRIENAITEAKNEGAVLACFP